MFHTSPFWVRKVRRVCGACHHRFATSDGEVEQYLLKVHRIPVIRGFGITDAGRGQTWITFHMAMKAIASFMLTKNLHAVRRDFSRSTYEALWEQAISAGPGMQPIREYIPRALSSIPSRQYFRTFLQRFFAGLTHSAVSRIQEMTMAVEGGIIKVDGNYKISKKVCGESGSKAAFQKRLLPGECVILALGAKGGLLAPPSQLYPSESEESYSHYLTPILERMKKVGVTPKAVIIDSSKSYAKVFPRILRGVFGEKCAVDVLPDAVHRVLSIQTAAQKTHPDFNLLIRLTRDMAFLFSAPPRPRNIKRVNEEDIRTSDANLVMMGKEIVEIWSKVVSHGGPSGLSEWEKGWMVRMAGLPFVEFTPSLKAVFGCRPPTSLVRIISKDLGVAPDVRGRKYLPENDEFEVELDATRDFFHARRVFPRRRRGDIDDAEQHPTTGKTACSIVTPAVNKSFDMWKSYLPGFRRWGEYVEAGRQVGITLPEGASDVEAAWANMGGEIPAKVTLPLPPVAARPPPKPSPL